MIEKTENPLDLSLDVIESLITELQATHNVYEKEYANAWFSVDEIGVGIEITIQGKGTYIYSLAQCKALKAEFENPVFQSLGEVS